MNISKKNLKNISLKKLVVLTLLVPFLVIFSKHSVNYTSSQTDFLVAYTTDDKHEVLFRLLNGTNELAARYCYVYAPTNITVYADDNLLKFGSNQHVFQVDRARTFHIYTKSLTLICDFQQVIDVIPEDDPVTVTLDELELYQWFVLIAVYLGFIAAAAAMFLRQSVSVKGYSIQALNAGKKLLTQMEDTPKDETLESLKETAEDSD